MYEALGEGTWLGYCTNVHAGATYEAAWANLGRYATGVRERVCPGGVMGVGLWLSASGARRLLEDGQVEALREWLSEHGLAVFTLNGFPYGDFHAGRVKREVYRPDWRDGARLAYTLDLIEILGRLGPEGGERNISTLPVGWGAWVRGDVGGAVAHFHEAARRMARVREETGRVIHLDVEPEPGCELETGADVIGFLGRVFEGGPAEAREHVRVCHDVCHAAVMGEDQRGVLGRYEAAGIKVGKIQISSALRVRFGDLDEAGRKAGLEELERFAEDRYMHQTMVWQEGGEDRLFDDLPDALAAHGDGVGGGEWRVHFHVPVDWGGDGLVETTRGEIGEALEAGVGMGVRHFEVETYAWGVLPGGFGGDDLAAGLSRELRWVLDEAGRGRVV